jgi:shikimate kinase
VTTPRPYVVVIGAPGAGKTRVGKRIARLLKVPFVDTDRRIVLRHGPIAQVFSGRGEEHFRKIERIEVARALRESAVVSLGGGAVLDPDTQADLTDLPVALMTVSAEAVASRIGDKRPLLREGGVAAWETLVAARRETYERLATRTWDSSERPIDTIAQEIADWVRSLPDQSTRGMQP